MRSLETRLRNAPFSALVVKEMRDLATGRAFWVMLVLLSLLVGASFDQAVAPNVADFRDGEISVRFKGISGRIDQGAGILFNLKPNGDYLTIRANPLENNLVLWKFEKGRRSSVNWIRHTPTPTRQWHDLKVVIRGATVEGYVNGKLYLTHTLPAPVSGRVGLWSKADSHVYFDNYTVSPAN